MVQPLTRLVAVALEATQQRVSAEHTNRPKQKALWLDDMPNADAIVLMFPYIHPDKTGAKHLFIVVPGTEFSYDATVWLMSRRVTLYPDGNVLCAHLGLRPEGGHLTSRDLARRATELRWQIGEAEIDDYVIDL
jgi:hypothetical protein